MSRLSPELVISDGENAMKVDKSEKDPASDGSENGGEEEEYEIEQILDAKRGAFPEGRMGYLVKWKGYGDEENSWVDERDAENAKELVEEFWKKNPKKKPRKSEPGIIKRGRKSTAQDDHSDTPSTAKRRGRKSMTNYESLSEDGDTIARIKKPKKDIGRGGKGSEEPVAHLQDMSKYMDMQNWEELVDTVDTVERTDEGLVIYFTLKSGETIRERGNICRKRLPQKLLSFYESNLKWRQAEEMDVED